MNLTKKDKIQIGIIAIVVLITLLRLPAFVHFFQGRKIGERQGSHRLVAKNQAEIPGFLEAVAARDRKGEGTGRDFGVSISTREAQVKAAKQSWGRDPFYAIQIDDTEQKSAPKERNAFMLKAISVKGGRAVALVNGLTVHEGDQAFGMTVKSIQHDRVVLTENGHDVVLRFGGPV